MYVLDDETSGQLELLRRQHHALYPPYLLRLPPPQILAAESSQSFLIEKILFDPIIKHVQPDKGYSRSFWRRIVKHLEEGIHVLQARGEDVSFDGSG